MSLTRTLVRKVKSLFRRGGLASDSTTATQLRDVLATSGSADAAELGRRLAAGEITATAFSEEMFLLARRTIISQYALAKGGIANLTADDLTAIGKMVGAQADYLRGFLDEIAQRARVGNPMTAEEIAGRAALYGDAGIEAASRGMAAANGLDLPQHPPAHVLCRCSWGIQSDDRGVVAYWQTAEDDRVCPICTGLADQYNPWVAA